MPDPILVTVEEARALLCVGRSLLYRLIAEGKLPVVKLGRATRVRLADIQRLATSPGTSGKERA